MSDRMALIPKKIGLPTNLAMARLVSRPIGALKDDKFDGFGKRFH